MIIYKLISDTVIFILLMLLLPLETPELPHFTIQANSTLLLSGDTLVIKCLIYNISLLTLVNSYSLNWFKDDVQITNSFSDVINDARFREQLNGAKQEQNVMSELQIKSKYSLIRQIM